MQKPRRRSAPWFYIAGSSAADGLRIAGDDELLVRRDDEHLDLGVGGGDHDVLAALAVGGFVDLHAQIAEVLGDGGAGGLAVLADARR